MARLVKLKKLPPAIQNGIKSSNCSKVHRDKELKTASPPLTKFKVGDWLLAQVVFKHRIIGYCPVKIKTIARENKISLVDWQGNFKYPTNDFLDGRRVGDRNDFEYSVASIRVIQPHESLADLKQKWDLTIRIATDDKAKYKKVKKLHESMREFLDKTDKYCAIDDYLSYNFSENDIDNLLVILDKINKNICG